MVGSTKNAEQRIHKYDNMKRQKMRCVKPDHPPTDRYNKLPIM